MKKKMYPQPEMKVVKLEQTDIICTSTPSLQNESYEEENDVTNIWFNK